MSMQISPVSAVAIGVAVAFTISSLIRSATGTTAENDNAPMVPGALITLIFDDSFAGKLVVFNFVFI